MATLGIPTNTISILQKYNFKLQKKYGQNFLIDRHVLEKIVEAAAVTKEDCVLEIGPGIGTMTQYLAETAGKVIAVEIDRALIPILQETLADYDNTVIINEDILKADLAGIIQTHGGDRPIKVVANLPYYITTPIIMSLFEQALPLISATVMVQKEVAERMQVGPGTKDYGALSLAVQYYARPKLITTVPPGCFLPKPKVGSAVIHLERYEQPPVAADAQLLFAMIRASFNQRRKTLVNGLVNAGHLQLDRETVAAALGKMGLDEAVRGETLTLNQFAELAGYLKEE